jgi:hypothetical protein
MRKVLFAVDGSQTSDEMIAWASENFLSPEDQVLAVHVRQHPSEMFVLDPSLSQSYDEADEAVRII